jgi:6-pyruvoyltetrahydropterin/6-carboxytetrahydropterin synthase
LYLVKVRVTFSAAHRLCVAGLSNEENHAIYGRCANPSGHGHNYDLEVAVRGQVDPVTGMVVNFYELNELVRVHILDKVDHKNLNDDVDFLKVLVPTAENLAGKFWEILAPRIRNGTLHSITISESSDNEVTYLGPDQAP